MRKFIGLTILGLGIIISSILLVQALCPAQMNTAINNLPLTSKGNGVQYHLNMALPSANDKMTVYKIIKPNITRDSVKTIANNLGLSTDPQVGSSESGTITVSDGNKQVEVYNVSGAMWYTVKGDQATGKPNNLTDEKGAIRTANKFLMDSGLMPKDAQSPYVTPNEETVWDVNNDTVLADFPISWTVHYNRSIDGKQIVGPGNRLNIIIGNNNEVPAIYKAWRDLMPYSAAKIKTPAQAYSDLTANNQVVNLKMDEGDSVNIKRISLGYWIDSAERDQAYALPVYIFNGDWIHDNMTYKDQYEAYVYATDPGEIQ